MAQPSNDKDDRELARLLAGLFDSVGPGTRSEAEEELRTAGVDPDEVGQRLQGLAYQLLNNPHAADATKRSSSRQVLTRSRAAWAIAATLLLCLIGWALTRDTEPGGGLLQRYRDRVQRERAQNDQHVAVRLPHADPGQAAKRDDETPAPEQTPSAPTPAAPTQPGAEATGPGEEFFPPTDVAIGAIDAPIPRGGIIQLAGSIPAGEIVTARNVEAHNAALSPGLQWAVRNGLQIRTVEPRSVVLPSAYRAVTEQYANQTRIGPDGLSLVNYTAGLPFPAIDPNDNQAALKIMWNYEYRPFATDDLAANDFELESGAMGDHGTPMAVDRRITFAAFRRLFYTGRLFVDPKPVLSDAEGIRYRESLRPVREPVDLRGVGQLMNRYTDVTKQDDTWLYLPASRRVRRLSTAQRSDALFGQDVDPDSYFGFSGQLAWMTWRLIAEGEVPGCLHAENRPVKWGAGSADFVFDDAWEMRPVFVVEGTSKLPQYAYGKRVLYIDQETWVVLMSDIYDRQGELWKIYLGMYSADDATGAIDNPAAVMIDVQNRQVTRIAVPSARHPDSPGWQFNQGEKGGVTEAWFKIAHLIESGH